MRILLTGATGFIGSNLLKTLTGNHEVIALTHHGGERPSDEGSWVVQDLTRPLDTGKLPERLDAVIHLAQSRRYREFPGGAADVFAVNVQSTFHLLEYARAARARVFIFASSGGVYGSGERPLSEDDRTNPLSFYLSSKCGAEALVSSYESLFATVIFRFFFVYGPHQTHMLVPSLVGRVRNGETVVVDGDPGLRINPIYVADAVRAFEPALRLGTGDVVNVAGDEIVTITDLVHLIEDATGMTATIDHAPAARGGDLVGDNDRMKEALGVEPRITLSEGLAATVAALQREMRRVPT